MRVLDGGQKALFIKGLYQKVLRAHSHRLHRFIDRPVCRDDDHHGILLQGQHVTHKVKTIAIRQHQIQQHDTRPQRPKRHQTIGGGASHMYLIASMAQHRFINHLQR